MLHVTDVQNTGVYWRDEKRTHLEDYGKLPHLVRAGTAMITLRGPGFAGAQVWAVDLAGRRVGAVDALRTDASLSFEASTHRAQGAGMVYEVIRGKAARQVSTGLAGGVESGTPEAGD